METRDQINRLVALPKTPSRIISLVPSQTELLVDLGLKNELVGLTKFCVHPAGLRKEKVVVGGTKQIRIEKIKALNPDLIICNKEENTKEIVDQLSLEFPVWVSDIVTVEDCLEMISEIGKICNKHKEAIEIGRSIEIELDSFLKSMKGKLPIKTAYLIWKNPYMAAGPNTFIQTLLNLNNFKNIFGNTPSRYPEINSEELKKADLILLSSEPYPFKEKDRLKLEKDTNAKVLLVDGEYFSWYGSRLQNAFSYFKTLH